MFFMPLTVITQEIYKDFSVSLDKKDWAVVCLCAEWCGTCRGYSKHFEEFAQRHGDKTVAWLDIEDNSELLGDLDIENFPTILVQYKDIVVYFATVLPDIRQLDRLLASFVREDEAFLTKQAQSSEERKQWQTEANLKILLRNALDQN